MTLLTLLKATTGGGGVGVAHVTSSQSHASAAFSVSEASFNWTHTTTTDPQGVLILVFQGVSATNAVTSVTYGGTTIPAVTGGAAHDTATEPGSVTAFFLGSGVPTTDNPLVQVNRTNNTTSMWAVCCTQTAATDTEIAGIVLAEENGAIAEQSVDDGSTGVDSVRYSGVYYGGSLPAPAGANSTLLGTTNDAGLYGWTAVRETSAGQGARSVGCTQATSDDRAIVALAVREVYTPPGPQVTVVESARDTASPKTVVVPGCSTGDVLYVHAGGDAFGPTNSVTAAGAATTAGSTGSWTELAESLSSASEDWCGLYKATVTASGSVTVQISRTQSGTAGTWHFWVEKVAAGTSSGENVTTKFTANNTQVISAGITQDSAVSYASYDWDATSTPTGFTPAGATEVERSVDANYGEGSAYWLAQAAGTRNYGTTGFSTSAVIKAILLEVLAASTGTNAAAVTATATGAANAPSRAIALGAGSATASGTANNATAVTGALTNAAAGVATATGTANGVTALVKPTAGIATATGVAYTPPPQSPYVATVAGTGTQSHFADQNGDPILVRGYVLWGLLMNAGRWGGTWQSDLEDAVAGISAMGVNVLYTEPLGNTQNGGAFNNGNTWDGVAPFSSTSPVTFNTTFWQRSDYLFDLCEAAGITIFFNFAYSDDLDTAALSGFSTTQFSQYGTALANRFKTRPNLVWMMGGDYFDTFNTQITAVKTAIRAAGDTHLFGVQNYPETTSRKDIENNSTQSTGTNNAEFNFVYSYNAIYWGIEYAWTESSPLPVMWGDGHFDQDTTADRKVMRDLTWWTFSSGGRGMIYGSEGTWAWASGALANLTSDTFPNTDMGGIWNLFAGFTNWHLLVPDTDSSFVTAGRGTKSDYVTSSGGGGGEYNSSDTQAPYVTASITPDGTLAVVYFPVDQTITVDDTELGAGYTATWVDPTNGSASSATIASTYSPTGNNALGGPDWLLVFVSAGGTDASAGSSTGTGTANAPSPSIRGSAGAAAGSGTANNATVSTSAATNAAAGVATASTVAQAPSAKINPVAGSGAAAGSGNNATVAISGATNAAASTAAASGVAPSATGKVSPSPATSSASGVGNNATAQTGSFTNAAAGTASATGVGQQATGKVGAGPSTAGASAVANAASAGSSVSVQAGVATATGTSSAASITRGTNAQAGVATAVGTVSVSSLRVLATAEAAAGLAAAFDAVSPPSITTRPYAGVTTKPGSGRTIRPFTGVTDRP